MAFRGDANFPGEQIAAMLQCKSGPRLSASDSPMQRTSPAHHVLQSITRGAPPSLPAPAWRRNPDIGGARTQGRSRRYEPIIFLLASNVCAFGVIKMITATITGE